jgi:hypothetical protein
MDSLLAIFAAPPTLARAAGVLGDAAAAAARPFAEILGEMTAAQEPAADDAPPQIDDELLDRLQELLAAAGIESGQFATVNIDAVTGRVDVDHASPLAADVAALIEDDAQLLADLQALAEREAPDGALELLVEVA